MLRKCLKAKKNSRKCKNFKDFSWRNENMIITLRQQKPNSVLRKKVNGCVFYGNKKIYKVFIECFGYYFEYSCFVGSKVFIKGIISSEECPVVLT